MGTALTSLLTVALFVFPSAEARATMSRPFERGFGMSAESTPMSAAFDSGGNLYVLGSGARSVIQKLDTNGDPVPFSASHSYIDGNELTGTPDSAFQFESFIPTGIAVDNSGGPRDGYIYVGQSSPGGLDVFDATGTYKGMVPGNGPVCGVAVNQSNGDLYTSEYYSEQVRRFVPSGDDPAAYTVQSTLQPVGSFACAIAVDAAGDLYASGYPFWGAATKFESSEFGNASAVGTPLGTKPASQFAIDPVTGVVYADFGERIDRYDSTGSQILPSIADGDLASSAGMALAPDGRLYATETTGDVSVYGPADLDLPLISTGDSSAVLQNTASLSGEVDPDSSGDVDSCEFRYGPDKSYSSGAAPCVPAPTSGSPISAPTAVTADLSGLEADTVYHYRLFAGNANGEGAGHDRSFKTPLAIAGVTTGAATSVAKDAAILNGSYTGDGQDVHYYFEYGLTASYGAAEPAPPGNDAGIASGEVNLAPVAIDDLQGATTYHYRLVATNLYGTSYGADMTFTTEPAVTDLAAGAPSGTTNETAELHGSFAADDYDTHYYFDYGPTDSYGSSAPAPPGNDAGTGSGPIDVNPVTIGGLQQGSTYHFRIVAQNSRGVTKSADRTFRTADAPSIRSFWSENVKETSADLGAVINPQMGETSYRFEYGTSTNFGTTVPIPDEAIGSGSDDKTVGVHLEGLEVGRTYYFQVVAENQYGTTESGAQTFDFYPPQCPNAQIRQETNSDNLPDCRAYEIASPNFAGGTTIFPAAGPNTGLATQPARIAFGGSFGAIPGAGDPTNTMGDLYVATRSTLGWTTRYIGRGATKTQEMGGPPEAGMIELLNQSPDKTQRGTQATPDMSRILSWDDGKPVYGAFTGSNAPYVWDASSNALLDRWPSNLDQIENGEQFLGKPLASGDFSHFIFSSNVVFADGGVASVPPSLIPQKADEMKYRAWDASVYDNNTVTGEVALASRRADESSFSGVPLAVSTDGSHIVISEGPGSIFDEPAPLMVRIDGERTEEIADGHPVTFVDATADGRTVYFTSPDPLTGDDLDTSVDLFMWKENSPDPVTRVSFGDSGNSGNSDDCNVSWAEKCGLEITSFSQYASLKGGQGGNGVTDSVIASGSGDIYFQSPEQLDGAKGEFGQDNLYVYRDGEVQFVATMNSAPLCTTQANTATCSKGPIARMQVTPDGAYAAFITPSQVTSYDNDGRGLMYRYEAANGKLICVSCKRGGEPPSADVYGSQNGLFLTNDGRAFFSTEDSIVRRDTNGATDVYEYTGGRPQLVTSGFGLGTGQKFTGFTGLFTMPGLVSVSADGVDAYFATLDQLVTQDHNGEQLKIYDARTNGGFAADVPPQNCEAADECHGAGSGAPTALVEGTVPDLGNSGNVAARNKSGKKQKAAKKKAAKNKKGRKRSGKKHTKPFSKNRSSRNGGNR